MRYVACARQNLYVPMRIRSRGAHGHVNCFWQACHLSASRLARPRIQKFQGLVTHEFVRDRPEPEAVPVLHAVTIDAYRTRLTSHRRARARGALTSSASARRKERE